jgi:8-oxo-dGTP pyrophosphatase MutT (NUDIX family)
MSFLDKIPKGTLRGWTLVLNGQEVKDVESFQLSHPSFGTLEYGFRGYDRWAFREQNFGGSVNIPYSVGPNKEVLVGLVLENRDNMGGQVWCAPGGFSDGRETHAQTAAREFGEETGMSEISKPRHLPGLPVNFNRAFAVANPKLGQGVHNFTFHVPFDWLQPFEGASFMLKDEKLLEGFRKVSALRFIPINQATLMTADALALAAIDQLRVFLSL